MDEEKKIMEKRSSLRGWKERHKGGTYQKRNIIGIIAITSIFFALIVYPYWSKGDTDKQPIDKQFVDKQNKTPSSTIIKQQNKTPSPTPIKNIKVSPTNTPKKTANPTPTSKKNIIGKIGIPLVNNGFEITVKSITQTELYTSAWIYARNLEEKEKSFKLGPGNAIIDNIGQQYENIKVARSAEIAQTNLSAGAMREGAVFFERLKEGRSPKKLILNINNEKIEFMLNSSRVY